MRKLFSFYYEGFRNMTTGRNLWIIILVKLVVIFIFLKLLFFPDFLKSRFETTEDRSNYVLHELTKIKK